MIRIPVLVKEVFVGKFLLRSIVLLAVCSGLLTLSLTAQTVDTSSIKYYVSNPWAEALPQEPPPKPYVMADGFKPDGTPVPPRKPWGHPDLEGIWIKRPAGVGVNAAFQTQPLPFTPEGLKAFNNVWSYVDPTSKCIFPGVPRYMYSGGGNPVQFVQTPDKIVIVTEYMHNFRVIWLDGRRHPKNILPSYFGHSVGRFEGDTLVVDTVGLRGGNIDDHANVVSDALHMIERYRRVSANQMSFEAIHDDPKYYTKPWTASWLLPLANPNFEVMEYACTDFNYSMESGNQQPGPLDGSLRDGGPLGRPGQQRR